MNKKQLSTEDLKAVFGGVQSPDTGTPAPPPQETTCVCWSLVRMKTT